MRAPSVGVSPLHIGFTLLAQHREPLPFRSPSPFSRPHRCDTCGHGCHGLTARCSGLACARDEPVSLGAGWIPLARIQPVVSAGFHSHSDGLPSLQPPVQESFRLWPPGSGLSGTCGPACWSELQCISPGRVVGSCPGRAVRSATRLVLVRSRHLLPTYPSSSLPTDPFLTLPVELRGFGSRTGLLRTSPMSSACAGRPALGHCRAARVLAAPRSAASVPIAPGCSRGPKGPSGARARCSRLACVAAERFVMRSCGSPPRSADAPGRVARYAPSTAPFRSPRALCTSGLTSFAPFRPASTRARRIAVPAPPAIRRAPP